MGDARSVDSIMEEMLGEETEIVFRKNAGELAIECEITNKRSLNATGYGDSLDSAFIDALIDMGINGRPRSQEI